MSSLPPSPSRFRRLISALPWGLGFLALAWFYAWSPASFPVRWFTSQPAGYSHELTDGFLQRHLHLPRAPDPRLLALPDPYDPAANVPYRVNDLSYFNGRYYLYHSAVPALVLLAPVKLLTGLYLSEAGASLVFTLGGCTAALALLLAVRRKVFPRSPVLLVTACACVLALGQGYHVALRAGSVNQVPIASAYFFLMLALFGLWQALQADTARRRWLAAASLAYGLAIASRPNYVLGLPVLLVPLLAWGRSEGFRLDLRLAGRLLAAFAPAASVIMALLAYNWARFGNPLEFGARYMLGGWDQRALPSLGWGNLATNAYYYFLSPVGWHATFPFVTAPSWQATGLLRMTPFLWLLLLLPLAWRRGASAARANLGSFLLVLGGAAATNLLSLLLLPSGNADAVRTSANARYVLDFQPALVLLACLGVLAASELAGRPVLRRLLTGLSLLLALLSAGAGVSLDFQRFPPEVYRPLARLLNRPAWWCEDFRGVTYGPVELEVQLPTEQNGGYEPLLATGTPESGELVYIFYENPGRIRVGLVGTEAPGPLSESIAVDYARPHRLEFHLGSLYPAVSHPAMAAYGEAQVAALKRRLVVRLDGQPVLTAPIFFHPGKPGRVQAGATDFLLAYSAPRFSGKILAERRLPFPAPDASPRPPAYGPLRLRLQFPTGRDQQVEPLVVTGIPQAGDLVSVEYQGDQAVRFVTDHWGHRSVSSDWIPLDFSAPHTVEVSLGSLLPPGSHPGKERLRLVLDGRTVLDVVQPAYESSPYDVVVGRNVIGSSTAGYAFTGVITETAHLPWPAPSR